MAATTGSRAGASVPLPPVHDSTVGFSLTSPSGGPPERPSWSLLTWPRSLPPRLAYELSAASGAPHPPVQRVTTPSVESSWNASSTFESPALLPATRGVHPALALGDELFLGFAVLSAWGFQFWDWGTRRFHFQNEHGFTGRSSTGGADKTGHYLTAQGLSDFLAWRLREKGYGRQKSARWGAVAGLGLMLWIEVGDATSDFGFSYEDLVADALGSAVALARNASPEVRALVDFRIQWFPTRGFLDSGDVSADYSGMRHLMAVKLSGVPWIQRTPLRFVETHFGFFTRGFRTFDDNEDQGTPTRAVYWGLGLDVNALLGSTVPDFVRTFFSYYQVPFLAGEVQRSEYR